MSTSAQNEKPEKRIPIRVLNIIFLCFIVFGLLTVLIFGANNSKKATIMLWMMLFLLFGVAIGFLFGIPKVLQSKQPAPESKYEAQVNTNLTEISDWLTKIIVGLGLVHLTKIHAQISTYAEILSKALSLPAATNGSLGFAFGYGVIVSYTLLGFLYGYIMTRLFLAGAFIDADTLALAELKRETESIARKSDETAKQSQEAIATAVNALNKAEFAITTPVDNISLSTKTPAEQLQQLIADYNQIRKTMRPNSTRTEAMNTVFKKMQEVVPLSESIPIALYMTDKDDGKRLAGYAALYVKPDASLLDELIDALVVEPRAFNQYRAILTVRRILALGSNTKPTDAAIAKLKKYYDSLEDGWDRKFELGSIFPEFKSK